MGDHLPERDDRKSSPQKRSSPDRGRDRHPTPWEQLTAQLEAELEAATLRSAKLCAWTEFKSPKDKIDDLVEMLADEITKPTHQRKSLLGIERKEAKAWRRSAFSKFGLWGGQLLAIISIVIAIIAL